MTNSLSLTTLLNAMISQDAADLYLTKGCSATLRLNDKLEKLGDPLTGEQITALIQEILTPEQYKTYEETHEFNSAYHWNEQARFRINVFRQQQEPGVVIRRINIKIPSFSDLNLPEAYQNLVMEKRGLVLIVGPTGSGKSSSLAAMVGHRNKNTHGHIITIEDPIEFIHFHDGCIITQRDVGIDTISFEAALKNALRQRPDVVLIGEIRDRAAMEHAINFAETGHLCLATLHANNSYQAIERVLSFFSEEKHKQVLMNLALNLRGILSQRLLPNKYGRRSIATEIMLNEGLIKQLIEEGKIKEIRHIIEKNHDVGMHSFDQSLLELFNRGEITEDQALAESDNAPGLRLQISQARAMRATQGGVSTTGTRQHFTI